jgi:hypothetical protein
LQFFYGVDWASIRDIDAPFVPHLKSITDTSYFPTDEIDQTNDLPVGAEDGDDAKKDLAFLGYTYVSLVFPFFPFLAPISFPHLSYILVLLHQLPRFDQVQRREGILGFKGRH